MRKVGSGRKPLKICVCVVFNHPFPSVLPLIRKMYKDRFSKVLFFMPFERMPDEDVITVYHGCYASPAFITESRHILNEIDCDFFMFIHDDVILNPALDEDNFRDYFPLSPEDAFIPGFGSAPDGIGDWSWYFGSVPKMFFPKSMLFSGGIEFDNLYKYLPDAKQLTRKFEVLGVPHKTFVRLDPDNLPDVEKQPSRVLFHGITRSRTDGSPVGVADGTPAQDEAERLSLEAARLFVRAMVATIKADDPESMRGHYKDLPFPLISTGFLSDFYILPKGKLQDYAHYAGVFTAANIWHETMVATVLHAICRNVRTAEDFGLNFAGFWERPGLEAFRDPDYMAIHPIKLSPYVSPQASGSFLETLASIREGREWSPSCARPGLVSFGAQAQESFAGEGWFNSEEWGRWAGASDANVVFDLPERLALDEVKLVLQAPLHEKCPTFTGEVVANNNPAVRIEASYADFYPEITLPAAYFSPGRNTIIIRSDKLLRPADLDRTFQDERGLGFGLRSLEFVQAISPEEAG